MTEADTRARQIAVLTWAVHDALQAAETIANRAGEQFQGDEALILFDKLRHVIGRLRTRGPEMIALRDAGIGPTMRAGGKADGDLKRWPPDDCLKPRSCSRHGTCVYIGCKHATVKPKTLELGDPAP